MTESLAGERSYARGVAYFEQGALLNHSREALRLQSNQDPSA